MNYIDIDNFSENKHDTAVALGNFDGVHIGHQKLIRQMIDKSKELGLVSSVFMFKNHTKIQIEGIGPELICSTSQRKNILSSLGVERIFSMNFSKGIMKYSPQEFIKKILIDKLRAKLVVVGLDYRFGYKKSGDANLIKEICKKYDIEVIIIDPVKYKNEDVSSTRIRYSIKNGDMIEAENMLGRRYTIIGNVVTGKKLGKVIGFPTANIDPIENYVIPRFGVYITETVVNNISYLSITNVGINPTFENKGIKIESHILDFNNEIYNTMIEINFISYLRDEIKFSNIEELKDQIEKDILSVKQYSNHLQ